MKESRNRLLSGGGSVVAMLVLCMAAMALVVGCTGKKQEDAKAPANANAPADAKKQVISNCGSDTMVNLAQMWAEEYQKIVPGVTVEVSGGGSGVGIKDLVGGLVDIANSSRDITESEKQQAVQNTGKEPREWKTGADGIGIYVNGNNPMETITVEQLAAIFGEGGTIETWSQLGVDMSKIGAPDEIVRVSRQNNSGTYVFFREHVLNKKDFKLGSRDMSGSKDVVELIARAPGAIGYSGMGYKTDAVKMLKVAPRAGETAVAPSVETVLNKTYPLARPLHMYTLGEPQGAAKDYITWVLSPAGQAIVEQAGYVPNQAK